MSVSFLYECVGIWRSIECGDGGRQKTGVGGPDPVSRRPATPKRTHEVTVLQLQARIPQSRKTSTVEHRPPP
ncbi:unnamed protein product, partial [Iphiclides podalirius]